MIGVLLLTLSSLAMQDIYREKVKQYSLVLDVHRLMEVRVGEGFRNARLVETFVRSKSEKSDRKSKKVGHYRVSVAFSLEWHSEIWIEYIMAFRSLAPYSKSSKKPIIPVKALSVLSWRSHADLVFSVCVVGAGFSGGCRNSRHCRIDHPRLPVQAES